MDIYLISDFMISKNHSFSELIDLEWIADLAFLTDITEHLNILNLTLQGKDCLIYDLGDAIKGFKRKLELWGEQLAVKNCHFFPRLKAVSLNNGVDVKKYSEEILKLLTHFRDRFAVLDTLQGKFDIFVSPFSQNIQTAPAELQIELIELQCSTILKNKFLECVDVIQFYKMLDTQKYKALQKFAANMVSMFGSTYTCEQFFSKMNLAKTRLRNRLSEVNFAYVMRIAAANSIKPNIDLIVGQKRGQ